MKREYNPLQKLIDSKRMPALFIGSGVSKRYLKEYPNWYNLLICVAKKLGVNQEQLLAVKNDIKQNKADISDGETNQLIGEILEKKFNRLITEEKLFLKDFFNKHEIEKLLKNQSNCFKALVAQCFLNYEIKTDKSTTDEIELFKKVSKKCSGLYTTNYDTFLEDIILDKETNIYSVQDQYYFRDNSGYGELYKIHGCVKNSDTIIFSANDYKHFDDRLKLISSKLLNTLMDFPIVFLGYSFNDENIKRIFETFVSSFSQNILKKISDYLIYVQYDSEINDLKFGELRFGTEKTITMSSVTTNDFSKIFSYINMLEPSLTSVEFRKYKSKFAEIIRSSAKGDKNAIQVIGVEKIEELIGEKIVVAFGTEPIMEAATSSIRGDIGIGKNELVRRCLYNEQFNIDTFVNDWFDQTFLIETEYLPVYYLLNCSSSKNLNETSTKFQKMYTCKEQNFEKIKESIKININNIEDLKSYCKSRIKLIAGEFKYFDSFEEILMQIKKGLINKYEIKKYLQELYIENKEIINMSAFKKSLCYVDK